jgi:hypothetical protein
MFTREDGPFGIFDGLRMQLGKRVVEGEHGLAWSLAEIFNCPRCLGMWLAILFSPVVLWPTRGMDIALVILGIAGLQLFMIGRSNE